VSIVKDSTARIKKIILKRGITHQKLATALGISRPAVSFLLSGDHSFSLEQIDKIAIFLKIDPVELLYGKKKIKSYVEKFGGNAKMRTFYIPLLHPAEAHRWSLKDMEKLLSDPNRELMPVSSELKDSFAIPLYDMAMISEKAPSLSYNDLLIYDPKRKPSNGDYVIVKLSANEESICRKYMLSNDMLTLKPLNQHYPDIIPKTYDDYKILGVVIRIVTTPP
jgi:SOS-response transcriptional repressor LexA